MDEKYNNNDSEKSPDIEKGNYIYKRIEYKPRIWGLDYIHLFSCLGSLVLCLMVLRSVSFLIAALVGIISSGGLYGYFFYTDNIKSNVNAKALNKIKNKIGSFECSKATVKFYQGTTKKKERNK